MVNCEKVLDLAFNIVQTYLADHFEEREIGEDKKMESRVKFGKNKYKAFIWKESEEKVVIDMVIIKEKQPDLSPSNEAVLDTVLEPVSP